MLLIRRCGAGISRIKRCTPAAIPVTLPRLAECGVDCPGQPRPGTSMALSLCYWYSYTVAQSLFAWIGICGLKRNAPCGGQPKGLVSQQAQRCLKYKVTHSPNADSDLCHVIDAMQSCPNHLNLAHSR